MSETNVRRRLADIPEYMSAQAKLAELHDDMRRSMNRRNEINSAAQFDLRQVAAAAVAGNSPAPTPVIADLERELGAIEFRLSALRIAISEQMQLIDGIARQYANQIETALSPEYLRVVRRVIGALYRLTVAESEMQEFFVSLGLDPGYNGMTASMPLRYVSGLGRADDRSSMINYILMEAKTAGVFSELTELTSEQPAPALLH